MADSFLDTNVIIYLATDATQKADRAKKLVANGAIISVQVLNEAASVLRQKQKTRWAEVRQFLATIQGLCEVRALDLATHELAVDFAARFGFHVYDASILASAKLSGCVTLWSEDMQDGQTIDGVRIRNPF